MEPRSEKQKIDINVWSSTFRRSVVKSSAFRRSCSERFANDLDQPPEGGTPNYPIELNELWRLQAITTSPWGGFTNTRWHHLLTGSP
jgi:hypothetical protein